MNQIIIYEDNVWEARLHIYHQNYAETYIHNHVHPFLSICLDGSYIERLWWYQEKNDTYFYEFSREKGGMLKLSLVRKGELITSWVRVHFPGNILVVSSDIYHTIHTGIHEEPPITLIIKTKVHSHVQGRVFSKTRDIKEPTVPIRKTTPNEL